MKMFEIPVSDCGIFAAGIINELAKPEMPSGKKPPEFAVVIWYETKECAQAACQAAVKAHW